MFLKISKIFYFSGRIHTSDNQRDYVQDVCSQFENNGIFFEDIASVTYSPYLEGNDVLILISNDEDDITNIERSMRYF
jgi:hypothetical protein